MEITSGVVSLFDNVIGVLWYFDRGKESYLHVYNSLVSNKDMLFGILEGNASLGSPS
jgi:hypothetical protein